MAGGGGSQNTVGSFMKWQKQVPPETYAAYKPLPGMLSSKLDTGLSPEEKQFYTGQTMGNIQNQFAGAEKGMTNALARTGSSGGATTEAISDLTRGKAQAMSQGLAGITGQDLGRKQTNLENLMKVLQIPGAPVQTGQTTTVKGGGS